MVLRVDIRTVGSVTFFIRSIIIRNKIYTVRLVKVMGGYVG